jgi:hypothetical protein
MELAHEHDGSLGIARSLGRHTGSCHCGAVRFEVEVETSKVASRCNCSVCTKIGATGGVVKPSAFALLQGEASLSEYQWGARISRRFFCKHCGIHCFARGHLAELGGDYVSINLNCLDDVDPGELTPMHWDGRHNNWEAGPRSTPWPIFAKGCDVSVA